MNQRLFCFVIFLIANSNGFSQEITTIKILDFLSNKPIQNVKVTLNDSTYLSNHKGYCQFYSSVGDTIAILHPKYESIYVFQPTTRVYIVNLNRKEEYLEYSDGIAKFYMQIQKKLLYPNKARREKIRSKVYVEFQIDSVGGMRNIQIHNDPNKLFTDEILKVMNKLTGTWGLNYADKKFILPIEFKFSSSPDKEEIKYEPDSKIDRVLSQITVIAYERK